MLACRDVRRLGPEGFQGLFGGLRGSILGIIPKLPSMHYMKMLLFQGCENLWFVVSVSVEPAGTVTLEIPGHFEPDFKFRRMISRTGNDILQATCSPTSAQPRISIKQNLFTAAIVLHSEPKPEAPQAPTYTPSLEA